MKKCCEKFHYYLDGSNENSPNIRIVKFLPNIHQKKNYLRFFITNGYEKFSLDLIMMNIAFCPFCGENLFDFYKVEDTSPNEVEGITFEKIYK